MAQRVAVEDLDGRRPDIEHELTHKYQVSWTFTSGVDAKRFDRDRSLHNQARFQPLDKPTVELYREAVRRGDRFPPVIAYRPGGLGRAGKFVIIDGNHRLVAHAEEGAPLDVYEVAPETHPQTVALMTFALNTQHGRPTSEVERIGHAIYLVDNGASETAAAAAVNLSPRILRRALHASKADRRADEVGIRRNEWDTLASPLKARLVQITTDEGFAAAAKLAIAARLNHHEIRELASMLAATRSGKRQASIVAHAREQYADRIGATGAGVLGTAGKKRIVNSRARIGLIVGSILALPEDDSAIVTAYAAPDRATTADRLRAASARLTALADRFTADT
jgi:hypothetical protein